MADSAKLCSGAVENGVLVITILVDQVRESQPAYQLRDEMTRLIDETKASNVVLDLARVQFIGSVGFLAFLGVRRHLQGGRIVLCNLSDSTRDIFAVCRLIPTETRPEGAFEVEADVAAAVKRLTA